VRILALDPSLTGTGVALYGTELEGEFAGVRTWTIVPPAHYRGAARLHAIQQEIANVARGIDLVVIEGYAFSRQNQAHQLGELGGVIRLTLFCMRVPFVELAPSIRAKLATGKGNGSKDEVFSAAFVRLGYRGSSKDEADALWLLEAALQHYELPGRATLPQTHTERLAKDETRWYSYAHLKQRAEAR